MRCAGFLVLTALPLAAQSPVVVRGHFLESDKGDSGDFSIRAPDDRVYWYVYDSRTSVEQDHQPTRVPRLHKGDEIEIESDAGPNPVLPHARAILVLQSQEDATKAVTHSPISLGRYAMPRHPVVHEDPLELQLFMLRGTLDFAGLICHLNGERFVLRTRAGEQTVYLRPDTRFLEDGGVAKESALRPNTRVYVRASRNLDGEIEAFQVIWGALPGPPLR